MIYVYILLISLFIDLVSYLFMYVFIYIVNMSNVPKTSPDSEKITPSEVVGNSIAVTVASQLLRLLLHGEVRRGWRMGEFAVI